MEELTHTNDIEIKLLANRRFIYSNRRQNIVITAENNATEITVLYPDEYEDYSKRVDFVNSRGKEWTEALYIPEYREYEPSFHKTRFHFMLPTEVTTEGELKMQFVAYKPDNSMTTVPFEVIPIDVQDGVLAFKRNARSNPDLLILSYNQSTKALFNSQRAVAKSERTEADLTDEIAERKQADTAESEARLAGDSQNAEAIADETARAVRVESEIAVGLTNEIARAVQADADNLIAVTEETLRAQTGEATLKDLLNAETARAKAAEEVNAKATADETVRAANAENTLTADLAAEHDRASQAEESITDALTQEVTARTQADNTERQARIQGDTDSTAAIAAETKRATDRENIVETELNDEIVRARNAERLIAEAVQSETSRAQTAESNLQTALTAERERAVAVESNLQSELTNGLSKAAQSDAELRADLDAEISRAKTAEQINAQAVSDESTRAVQAETALGARLDTEVPAAIAEAKNYADQVTEQVRIDGTKYVGTLAESELPNTNNENGDLYWISDFNITKPDHSGSAIWNGTTNKWDFNIDRYKHQDNDTIVARDSDGALKVADTDESHLTPDTTDFGGTVQLGFKSTIRSVIRKMKGLFQKTGENAQAISDETARAQTAESGLFSAISTEVTRAKTAEQANANAVQTEAIRANVAESTLYQQITDEAARAQGVEQSNADTVTAEATRAQSAEAGLSSRITAEETRAKSAEKSNASAVTSERTRAQTAEDGLSSALAAETTARQNADSENAQAIAAEKTRAQTAEAGKVDKVVGKGLSTEDYTTTEKQKLADIPEGGGSYTHPATHPPSIIAQDSNNRFVTDTEKNTWNGKAPANHAVTATTYGVGSALNYGHVKLSSTAGGPNSSGGDTALKYNYATAQANIDLNTYVYEGRYTLYNVPATITDSANHFPSGWNTGSMSGNTAYLEVRRFYSDSAVHQTLYKRNSAERWVRFLSAGTWSAWKEVDKAVIDFYENGGNSGGGSSPNPGGELWEITAHCVNIPNGISRCNLTYLSNNGNTPTLQEFWQILQDKGSRGGSSRAPGASGIINGKAIDALHGGGTAASPSITVFFADGTSLNMTSYWGSFSFYTRRIL